MALDVPIGQEPSFSLICTFVKPLDSASFLISIPMKDGKPLPLDETQKLLICFGAGSEMQIVAGYADDIIKEGIRRCWKIRRVSEQRQFFRRVDERLRQQDLKAKLILQVHDELIVECPEEEKETVARLLTEEMEGAVHLSVPLTAEAHWGRNWLECKG